MEVPFNKERVQSALPTPDYRLMTFVFHESLDTYCDGETPVEVHIHSIPDFRPERKIAIVANHGDGKADSEFIFEIVHYEVENKAWTEVGSILGDYWYSPQDAVPALIKVCWLDYMRQAVFAAAEPLAIVRS